DFKAIVGTPDLVAKREAGAREAGPPALGVATDEVRLYDESLAARRLLPGTPGSAFDYLGGLAALPQREAIDRVNRLRVALEDRGQEVLLRYLTGEQVPQRREDFLQGAQYFAAARKLTPESQLLQAREEFCLGRAALFVRDYIGGFRLLERAA